MMVELLKSNNCEKQSIRKKGTVLGRANKAHGLTVVTVVPIVGVEVAVVEVHVVRVVAIVVRGRPVVAVAAHIIDRSPVAVASGRQEDLCTLRRLSFTSRQKNLFYRSQWRAFLFPFAKAQSPMNYPFFSCQFVVVSL